MKDTNEAVKALSPTRWFCRQQESVRQKDVYRAIVLGADGTGATSGIVAAKDPFAALAEMMEAMGKAKEDIGRKTI